MEERLSKEMLTEGIPLWNKKEGREEIHRFVLWENYSAQSNLSKERFKKRDPSILTGMEVYAKLICGSI